MNDYITLDGKRYHTSAENWSPLEDRPQVVRRLLSGSSNVTFGPATFTNWRGIILADVTPAVNFGSITDLQTTYRKRQALSFTDHYGVTCNVVVDRTVDPRSLSPKWDATDNVWKVNVTLIKL